MPEPFHSSRFTLSHVGLFIHDLDSMLDFYTNVLGFRVTDRGPARGGEVVFLSRNPSDHHQIALLTGRKTDITEHMVQQVSFRVETLSALKDLYPLVVAAEVTDMQPVFHGLSYSIYFRDPEGNRLEFFVDTEWYLEQPCMVPLDYTKPLEDIYAEAKAFAESQPTFRLLSDWRAEFERQLAV